MTKKPHLKASPRERQIIGWREMVGLPELGVSALRAKIDTGARTSALHAIDLRPFEKDGAAWIEFHVAQPGQPRSRRCSARLIDERQIKNTSGIPEQRYVIETLLVLGGRRWQMEVSLANREEMGFELILGRTAIRRRRLLVDPGRSFLAGPPGGSPPDRAEPDRAEPDRAAPDRSDENAAPATERPRRRKASRANHLQPGRQER